MKNPSCATVMEDKIQKVLDSKFVMHTGSKFLHWFHKCTVEENVWTEQKIITKVGFIGITKISVLTEQFMSKKL